MSSFRSWVSSSLASAAAPPLSSSNIANTTSNPSMKRKVFNKDSLDMMLNKNQQTMVPTKTPLKPPAPKMGGAPTPLPKSHLEGLSSPAFGASAFSPGAARGPPPASASPIVKSEFASHFRDRRQKGKKELSFGEHISFPSNFDEVPMALCQVNVVEGQQTTGYRYMYEKLTEKGDLLNERINYFASLFATEILARRKSSSDEMAVDGDAEELPTETGQETLLFGHPSEVSQESQFYIGRISCDTVVEGTRLNLHSLVLETSREIGAGARVKIDFSGLIAKGIPLYLFPGQIVCVEATNPSGNCLCVVDMLEAPSLAPPVTNGQDYLSFYPEEKRKDLKIVFAAGPFALNDSLEYEGLDELIDVVTKESPNLLLLMGPFVDIDHPLFDPTSLTENDYSFEEIFRLQVAHKLEKVKKMMPHLQIVLVPSQKEATLEWIAYPQPPLGSSIREHDHIEKLRNLGLMNKNGDVFAHLFPNPVQFTCNEVVVSLSNLDTIRDLIQLGMTVNPSVQKEKKEEEVGKEGDSTPPPPAPKDKFSTCFSSILSQRHFYPVFPPTAGACIDSTRALGSQPQDPCVLQVRPDILIMPSRLQYAVKEVDGCLCINPGFLIKGRTGGTFCKIQVHGLQSEGMGIDDVFENCVAERTRVDIVRL